MGIVHIGLGRFHRAHQALYTEQAIELAGGNWGIECYSLNSRDTVDALAAQQGLYTIHIQGRDSEKYQVVGCLRQTGFVPENPTQIIDAIANPNTHIVTLTITEKGYHAHAGDRRLDQNSSDVMHDLKNPTQPKSAIGVLALGLKRRSKIAAPLTLISCDNIQANGDLLKSVLFEFVSLTQPQLVSWMKEHLAFPNSVVDRIVPSLDAKQIEDLNSKLPYVDRSPIQTEPFTQWILEDHFAGPRPAWEKAGVILTKDVRVFEKLKLSLLNATHSFMAYFGTLKGHTFVNEAIADQEIQDAVRHLLNTELPVYISIPKELNLSTYTQSLIERFGNPHLKHRLLQIAMDGSVKIPQRWIPSLEFNLQNNLSISGLAQCLAAWMLFCKKASTGAWALNDPHAEALLSAFASDREPVEYMRHLSEIFPSELTENKVLENTVTEQYNQLSMRFLK